MGDHRRHVRHISGQRELKMHPSGIGDVEARAA